MPAAAPLVREIPWADPLAMLAAVESDPRVALLHGGTADARGRHSLLALEPFGVLRCRDGVAERDGRPLDVGPWEALREVMDAHRVPAPPGVPFAGGAVGWVGYEMGRHLEPVPRPPADDLDLGEMTLLLCDVVVALDNAERRAWIVSSGLPESDPAARRARAAARLGHAAARLSGVRPLGPPPVPVAAPAITSNFSREAYEAAVRRVIDLILAGDLFQANVSQRFRATLPEGLTPSGLFRRLAHGNPAPFLAYVKDGDDVVASSSPERFLRLDGRRVETRPIKGTRPRGAEPAEDEALAAELAASAKDRAENVMIVDLLRNDLSRVCEDRSVHVPELCAVERYATVMHLVSSVTGELRPGAGAVDLLAACFPGGSITGAPKIRAMEVIAGLEPNRRGPYCGAIGVLGWDGALDTSIAIRTFAIRGREATWGAGGGVVADSDPAAEYEETLAKARALVRALSP
ncbi:MAG TPA: aminodeoxychorismate synthase component I [Miltoncostaea sp.]|nr:aminodeoxychorismate synthase component I [Miltoncostaea sp.]